MKFTEVDSKTHLSMKCDKCGTSNKVTMRTYDLLMDMYEKGHRFFWCVKCGSRLTIKWSHNDQ